MFSPAVIMLVPLIGVVLLIPVFAVLLWFRARRVDSAKGCEACGYSRRGLDTPFCPECGTPWDDGTRAVLPDRSGASLIVIAVLIGVPAMMILLVLVFLRG